MSAIPTVAFLYILWSWLFIAVIYFFYRRWATRRIVCLIYNKQRMLIKKSVKPNKEGLLEVGTHSYYFKEQFIFYTSGLLLREPIPALVFEESKPDPIDLYKRTPPSVISSEELSSIMNDRTVSEFVSAQSSINPRQILMAVVVMGVVTSLVGLAGVYFLYSQFLGIPILAGI